MKSLIILFIIHLLSILSLKAVGNNNPEIAVNGFHVSSITLSNHWPTNTLKYTYSYNQNHQITSRTSENENQRKLGRDEYKYDENFNLLEELNLSWGENDWVGRYKYTNTFENNQLKLQIFSINEFELGWISKARYHYLYDDSGNLLSETIEETDSNGWKNNYRKIYTYDARGNRLTFFLESWGQNGWSIWQQYFFAYNENDSLINRKYVHWIAGEPRPLSEISKTYNSFGQIVTQMEHGNWSVDHWNDALLIKNEYDDNGNLLQSTREYIYPYVLHTLYKRSYTYDSMGNLLESRSEKFIDDNWENTDRESYTYNQENFEISFLSEIWQDGQWNNDVRTFRTYDASNNLSSITHERWFDGEWVRFSDRYTIFEFSDSYINSYAFSDYDKIEITWQDITSVEEDNPAIFITASPNPFTESTEINYTLEQPAQVSISFYDNMGNMKSSEQLGHKGIGVHTHKFSSGNLAQGMYYYIIHFGNQRQSGKLAILK
jgi:hypothetical protein